MDKGISHVLSMSILLYGLQRPIFNSQDKEPYSFVGLKAQEKTGLLLMPTTKVTKNVSAAEGGGNVLCSILISIKTKAWLYSFRRYCRSQTVCRGMWHVVCSLIYRYRLLKSKLWKKYWKVADGAIWRRPSSLCRSLRSGE